MIIQVNPICQESYNHLNILKVKVEHLREAKYQGVHKEMVVCAIATKLGYKIDPENQIGMMFASNLTYSCSRRPENNFCNLHHNQMEMFTGDILTRGKYPEYAL